MPPAFHQTSWRQVGHRRETESQRWIRYTLGELAKLPNATASPSGTAMTLLSLCFTAFENKALDSSWFGGKRSALQRLYDLDQVGGQTPAPGAPPFQPQEPEHPNADLLS